MEGQNILIIIELLNSLDPVILTFTGERKATNETKHAVSLNAQFMALIIGFTLSK